MINVLSKGVNDHNAGLKRIQDGFETRFGIPDGLFCLFTFGNIQAGGQIAHMPSISLK
jgi:hypothetical protein